MWASQKKKNYKKQKQKNLGEQICTYYNKKQSWNKNNHLLKCK